LTEVRLGQASVGLVVFGRSDLSGSTKVTHWMWGGRLEWNRGQGGTDGWGGGAEDWSGVVGRGEGGTGVR